MLYGLATCECAYHGGPPPSITYNRMLPCPYMPPTQPSISQTWHQGLRYHGVSQSVYQ